MSAARQLSARATGRPAVGPWRPGQSSLHGAPQVSELLQDRKDGDAGDLQVVVADPVLNAPLLPFRLRLRASDEGKAWGRLMQLPWTSTRHLLCRRTVSRQRRRST